MSGISQATLYWYILKKENSSETNINPSNKKTAQILMNIELRTIINLYVERKKLIYIKKLICLFF